MTTTLTNGVFGPHIKNNKYDPTTLDITLDIDGTPTTARLEHTMDDTDVDKLWLGTIYKHLNKPIDATRDGNTITAFGHTWTVTN
ncbi:hypothetical protein CH260_10340 [Rhodococcus sp. 05-2256-B2]|uniref:hypothetical protein n=1 Tax=unclassified Rhodococcus (in: high G+C Gram-positive bacteria) TaxID=192944 RepID=UPI000B9BA554|nr:MULTISPECIES: hypothetical protein [unclassified Rhodococcus (in: high G+C Gram-positive bacteria)]OZD81825.1 hypothetical protein CH258_19840 [Rhodococcus sp. 05-2256-B4]OZD90446.1 hypothetical protein CH257_18235 [Rhodococcus sp. 05-2256-B3]OZD96930.1 hypothetical protein CH260_10340 [Rhodococcus sp. 05-2256-B2]OZE00448.1 hypothetical protein CH285_19485 [Rhodococcus sp. 05-2256-B1]